MPSIKNPVGLKSPTADRWYAIRIPTLHDRARLRQNVTMAGARQHTFQAMTERLRVLAFDVVEEPALQRQVLDCIDKRKVSIEELANEDLGSMPVAEAGKIMADKLSMPDVLKDFEAACVRMDEEYRTMIAENQVYHDLHNLEMLRMFIADWDGLSEPAESFAGLLSEWSLDIIPAEDRGFLVREVGKLLRADREEKNAFARSHGRYCDRKTSKATSNTPQATPPQATMAGTSDHGAETGDGGTPNTTSYPAMPSS